MSTLGGLLEISPSNLVFPFGTRSPFSFDIWLENHSQDLDIAFRFEFARPGMYSCSPSILSILNPRCLRRVTVTVTRDADKVQEEVLMALKKQIEGLDVKEGLKKDLMRAVDVQKRVIDYLQDDPAKQDMLLDEEIHLHTVVLTPEIFTEEDSDEVKQLIRETKLPITYVSTAGTIISKLSSLPMRLFSTTTQYSAADSERRKNPPPPPICVGDCDVEINPGEIRFPFELNKKITCSIQISNCSESPILFIFTTTAQDKYSATPYFGVVRSGNNCEVTFTMQSQKQQPPQNQCKDFFSVRIISLFPEVINNFKNVDSFKLELVRELPPQHSSKSPPPVPEGSQEESSSSSTREELIRNLSRIFKQKSSAWTTQPDEIPDCCG